MSMTTRSPALFDLAGKLFGVALNESQKLNARSRNTMDGVVENVYRLQLMNASERVHRYRITARGIPGVVGYWDRALVNRFANTAYGDWLAKQGYSGKVDPALLHQRLLAAPGGAKGVHATSQAPITASAVSMARMWSSFPQ